MKRFAIVCMGLLLPLIPLFAEGWELNSAIFNPSGVPSLTFSQPRFADLDGDGDMDMILGNTADKPYYMTNTGTATAPAFHHIEDIFENVSELDAEIAVCVDIDADGDLDLITGGYLGLNLYRNTGFAFVPSFEKVDNYFSNLTVGHNPVPDMADIDNDGDLDLVLGFSESGVVKVYTNTGTDTTALFLDANAITLGDMGLFAYPVFCDPDTDGDMDILVGKDGYTFVYYRNTGTASAANWEANNAVFSGPGSTTYFNSPAMVDINGDGKEDLIYGNASGPLLYYRNSGTISTPAWTQNTTLFGGVLDVGGASSPFFYDFDADGDMDMISGSQMGDIKYYQNIGTSTGPAWQAGNSYFAALKHSIYSSVTVGDVDGDGRPDAIVGDLSGNLYLHTNTGSGFSPAATALSISDIGAWSVPRLIDMDHDGDLDIVAGNEDGNLFFYDNLGSATAPMWSESFSYFDGIDVGSNCVPAFADLDFDGDYDLITGDGWREIQYFENVDGAWVEDTTMFAGMVGQQNTAPGMADLDGDGDQDLILGNYGGTFDYYENTHEVVAVKPSLDIPETYFLNAYPNPFNPSTSISYQLPANSRVQLMMYDINGKYVTTLANTFQSAGDHTFNFSAPATMSTGIYLCTLKIDGVVTDVLKLNLVK